MDDTSSTDYSDMTTIEELLELNRLLSSYGDDTSSTDN